MTPQPSRPRPAPTELLAHHAPRIPAVFLSAAACLALPEAAVSQSPPRVSSLAGPQNLTLRGGFVERAAEVGLAGHTFLPGLDRIGSTLNVNGLQSGIALGDLEGDGDLDVVACGGLQFHQVFRNDAGVFTEIYQQTDFNRGELCRAPALGDFDGDGDLDIFLGALDRGAGPTTGHSQFYRNDGPGGLVEITPLTQTQGSGHTLDGAWFDLDMDGLLDLYACEFMGTNNEWYRNNGDGTFTELAGSSGLTAGGSSHIVGFVDADRDGFPDVFVANDYAVTLMAGMPNNAKDYHFQGVVAHTFADVTAGSAYNPPNGLMFAIMGLAFGDVNYDGWMDIYKTNHGANYLMLNQGWPGSGIPWTEAASAYGVQNATVVKHPLSGDGGNAVGWGTSFLDADFDPWLDLVVVNGHIMPADPQHQQNFFFQGLGPSAGFAFANRTAAVGFLDHHDDRGLAVGDVDGDADLDLLVSPILGRLRYYENRIDPQGQGWILVRAETHTSAPGGCGTAVSWTDSLGYPHIRVIGTGGGTASQHAWEAYFGLGTEGSADLTVRFPSGMTRPYLQVPAGTRLLAVEPEMIRLPARTLPAMSQGGPATFSVTAFAYDASGNALGPSAVVTIDVPGLAATGPVVSAGGNTFQRTFTSPAGPGAYRVQVSFDGWAVAIEPRIQFVGPPDPTRWGIAVEPEAVRAGSADPFRVVVAPKDTNGLAIGPGHAMGIAIAGLTPKGPVTDLGDGRYSIVFPAPPAPGAMSVDLTLDGATYPAMAQVEVGGTADAATSTLYVESTVAGNVAEHQLKMMFTPRDAGGMRLGMKAQIQVLVTPDPGTPPVWVRNDLYPEGQLDGDYVIVLEKPTSAIGQAATGTLDLSVDGTLVLSQPYAF